MNREQQSAPGKKKLVPRWIRSTRVWKSLSNLKLALMRMSMSSAYWDRRHALRALRFFMAVERADARRSILHSFHFKGIQFDLRPMEWHLMRAILLEEEYGGPVLQLFNNQSPSVILDAGANVGMFSVYALSQWDSVKVFAVEPAPGTFRLLEQNQRQNPSLKWHAFQYAFWETDGSISFDSEGMSMAAHISADAKGVQVPSIRLDHFVEKYLPKGERISLLKMDIEGAEEAVLTAAQAVLRRVDAMVIEIHPAKCNESVVMDILKREFPFVYRIPAPSTQYPVVLACRKSMG